MSNINGFQNLDFTSSNPCPVTTETIVVELTDSNLFDGYAKAFVNETYRVNPLKAEKVQLTEEELTRYVQYLVFQRIQCVKMDCPDYRKLKVLYIPVWIQYVISMIGQVNLRDKGLKLEPEYTKPDDLMKFDEALAVSDKIAAFESELQVVVDAMPRSIEGDADVMTTAMIDGYVRAMSKVGHVSATYVTAFMGMKLKEEAAFKVLYRVQYDDIAFITSVLTKQKGLY